MSRLISALLAVFCVVGMAAASPMDSNGDYWYGWYGLSAGGVSNADAGSGTVSMTTGQTGTFNTELIGSYFSGTQSQAHAITSVAFDAAGYATLTYQVGSAPPPLALSPNLFTSVDRTARTEGFGGYMGVRKAAVTTDPTLWAGNYMYISHMFGDDSTEMTRGAITLYPNFTYTAAFYDLANNLIDTRADSWSYVAGQPQVQIHDDEDVFTFNLGANQTLGRIDWQDEEGKVNVELITRITTGRTLSEVAGDWLIEGLQTDFQGRPTTQWGTLSISGETYTFTFDKSSGGTTTYSGLVTLDATTTGKLTFFDGSNAIMQGYMDMAADALVLGFVHNGTQGLQLATRVPEPASMTLLLIGAAALVARRKARNG